MKWKLAAQDFSSPWGKVHVVLKALLQSPQLYYVLWLQKMQFSALIFLGKKWQNCIFLANCTHTYREAIRIQGHHWACTCKIKSSIKGSKKKVKLTFSDTFWSQKKFRDLFLYSSERAKKVLPDSSSAAQFTTYYLNDPKKNANFFPVTILMAVIYNRKIA